MLLKKFAALEHILVSTFNKTSYVFQKFGISCSHFPFTLKLLLFFFNVNSVILTRVSFSF